MKLSTLRLPTCLPTLTGLTKASALVLALLTFTLTAAAQGNGNKPTPAPTETATATNPADDYKKSLNDLAALYEKNGQRLEQENKQLKDLYRDGIISRVELEKNDQSLADARAKIEDIHNQITAANKPPAAVPALALSPFLASLQSWSSGSVKVDSLTRYYGQQYRI